jgi:hypothetical protein
MKIKLVAIDLAKLVFQVCIILPSGKVRSNKKYSREKFVELLKDLAPTTIAMEACATAHYWGRKLQAAGHTVKLVPAQHVKAFCRVHKSDAGDALAIAEAAQRPDIRLVPVKTVAQQDRFGDRFGTPTIRLASAYERFYSIRGHDPALHGEVAEGAKGYTTRAGLAARQSARRVDGEPDSRLARSTGDRRERADAVRDRGGGGALQGNPGAAGRPTVRVTVLDRRRGDRCHRRGACPA